MPREEGATEGGKKGERDDEEEDGRTAEASTEFVTVNGAIELMGLIGRVLRLANGLTNGAGLEVEESAGVPEGKEGR